MSSEHKNAVRIIGGRHRGRQLSFPDEPDLRPTGDRIRETLFNWLQPMVVGAHCLDLFAGSGALGLEAASRGARRVVMVDQSAAVIRQLRSNAALLQLQGVGLVQANAPEWLLGESEAFDIVFLDPPFSSEVLDPCCERLQAGGWLRPGASIYLEADRRRGLPELPAAWRVIREKTAGQVAYFLARAP